MFQWLVLLITCLKSLHLFHASGLLPDLVLLVPIPTPSHYTLPNPDLAQCFLFHVALPNIYPFQGVFLHSECFLDKRQGLLLRSSEIASVNNC